MFSWIKRAMERRAARLAVQQAQALRVQRVLLEQARAARTVRQVEQVHHLAVSWLPARLRQEVDKALQAALLLAPTTGFQRSTASPKRTGRSTSKRRRAR